MHIDKKYRLPPAFQSIIQQGYLFKPRSGMLVDTIPPHESTGPKVKGLWFT